VTRQTKRMGTKQQSKAESVLESAAQAIGSALGRLARQIGVSQSETTRRARVPAKITVGRKRAVASRTVTSVTKTNNQKQSRATRKHPTGANRRGTPVRLAGRPANRGAGRSQGSKEQR
jgi:hypothetical protein